MSSLTTSQYKTWSARPVVGFDFGTTKSAISYSVPDKIQLAVLSRAGSNTYESPAVVAYNGHGQIMYGEALEELVKDGKVAATDVLRNFKLLMYHEHKEGESTCAACVNFVRLSTKWDKSLRTIIFDYFVALLTQATGWIGKTSLELVNFSDYDAVLTSPSMWPAGANVLLTQAAASAGAYSSTICPETLASALCIIKDEILDTNDALKQPFQNGDLIVVCDCGGGTADMSLFELVIEPGSLHAAYQLAQVRPTTGRASGGSRVDDAFVKFLREREGTEAKARAAGFTQEEYLARMSIKFEEEAKRRFNGNNKFLVGVLGHEGEYQDQQERLTCENMKSFFDPVIKEIIEQVRETVRTSDDLDNPQRLKNIILTGGFGSSVYVRNAIDAAFPNVKLLESTKPYLSPVARGALLRHTTTTLLPPYLGWSLALVRNEDYDRNLHPDGRMDQKRRKAGSKRKTIKLSWNPAVVKKDDIDGNDVVEDRLNWIVNGKTKTVKVSWSDRNPKWINDHDDIELEQDVWFIAGGNPRDHDPLIDPKTKKPYPHLELFNKVKTTIRNPRAIGCKTILKVTKENPSGEKFWAMRTCMVPRFTDNGIELKLIVRNNATQTEALDVIEISVDEYINSQPNDEEGWTLIYDQTHDHVSQEYGPSGLFPQRQEAPPLMTAEQILAPFHKCLVAQELLAKMDLPQNTFQNAKRIFEEHPEARTNWNRFLAQVHERQTRLKFAR